MIYSPPLEHRRSESMYDSHSAALLSKHASLDARIASETRRPRPDEVLLHMLKKQKLKIKEALSRL
jgi:hypothetical protein